MKNMREELDIITAYNGLGTYRAAADLCGTTHKTVKRVVERHAAGVVRPDVRSILAAGTGLPTPHPAGDALVIDLPTATGRALSEYAPTTKSVSS